MPFRKGETKAARIALIKPPGTYATWYKRPMIGLSYLSALLEQSGFDCKIFDAYFSSRSADDLVESVVAYHPDLMGITAMTHEIVPASRIAKRIKGRLDIPAVVGGCHASALPSGTLEEFPVFDYVVHGEGEATFGEFLERLFLSTSCSGLTSVKGIAFREMGQVRVNEPRPLLTQTELDNLPHPAFHQYYGENPAALQDKNSCYVIASSRGCPYKCVFCMRVLGNKIRRRSAANICTEIEHAISCYRAHTIDFVDEIFLSNDNVTRQILDSFIKSGLSRRMRWSGLTRANAVNTDIIDLAKRAGCYRIGMGVESGNEDTLRALGKGITLEQVRKAVRIIRAAGLELDTYFIMGHPNETRETAQETIDLAVELNTSSIAVGIMTPYPGTRIFEMAKKGEAGYRLLSEDWSEYDKYGGNALELQGLSLKELRALQRKAYIAFYLRNHRVAALLKFLWHKRNGFIHFIGSSVTASVRRLREMLRSWQAKRA